MTTIEDLGRVWDVNREDVLDILERMDALRWAGGEGIASVTHAGTIDTGHSDMLHGHNGYWISDGEYIALITNGDPVWSTLDDEDACLDAGLVWGDPGEMLAGFETEDQNG